MSLENYFKLLLVQFNPNETPAQHNFYNSLSKEFHTAVFEKLKDVDIESGKFMSVLQFRQSICHKCNRKTPKLQYRHKMYGSKFRQQYGWYIKQQAY